MDRELLSQLIKRNDAAAQKELFEAYYRQTYAAVYSILRNRESAEDITQEAFIKAFRNLKALREPAKFGPWLAVIATNLARNHLKKEKKSVPAGNPPEFRETAAPASTEEAALRELESERLRALLRRLPAEQYQVIILQYYYDLTITEIAALLKVSSGTVKSRLFRAKQRLSRLLAEPEGGLDSLTF